MRQNDNMFHVKQAFRRKNEQDLENASKISRKESSSKQNDILEEVSSVIM